MRKLHKWISIADRHSKMHLDRMLRPLGMNSSHHMFLIKICENEGLAQDRLPGMVHINKSNVARALGHLEQRGFIERRANEEDRRALVLFPTAKGLEAYARILDIERGWVAAITDGFDEADKERLAEAVKRVAENAVRAARFEREED